MNKDIYLIRHGQPVLKNALLGATDSPLDESGWQQLNWAMQSLPRLQLLVSSPLSRCANFAQHYACEQGIPLSLRPEWRECYFGDWDGLTYQAIKQQYPAAFDDFIRAPAEHCPPKGETLMAFSQRVESALLTLVQNETASCIGIVTHAGVIRTLVAWCLKIDYLSGLQYRRFAIDYGSITHISLYQSQDNDSTLFPQLLGLNQQVNP